MNSPLAQYTLGLIVGLSIGLAALAGMPPPPAPITLSPSPALPGPLHP